MPRKPKLTYDRGTLLLHPPPRSRSWLDWATWDDRVEKFRIPAIAYRELLTGLQEDGIEIIDEAKAFSPLALQPALSLTPYPHQREALTAWKKGDRQGVIVLPTAAGKTYLAQLALECTPRDTLIVVPTLDLMHQWYAGLEKAFPGTELGLLGGGSRDRTAILIATYNSAAIHAETLGNRYGLLIFDECHHLPTDFFRVIAEYAIAPYRLGLTATPERADDAHIELDQLIGPILYRKSPDDLSGQALANHEVRQIKVRLTPEEQAQYAAAIATRNDFLKESGIFLGSLNGWQQFVQASARSAAGRRAMLAHRQAKAIALGTTGKLRVLTEILTEHYPRRTLIFTNDNATVYRISQDFLIPALTHQTPVKERHAILRRFKSGDYGAIAASHVLNEGVDVPDAEIAVILSGTGSTREYIQRLGRVLRKGKRASKQAILYEVITEDTSEERTAARRRSSAPATEQLELLTQYGQQQPPVPRAAENRQTKNE
ncbi:MAG: DEAD/DEAH box helicase family protein [Cyanobacteria bacterium P01_G01_bin.54]